MKELKQGWIDPGEDIPSENKGPYLVWDDTYYIWRLCHFVEGKWDEIRTRGVYPLMRRVSALLASAAGTSWFYKHEGAGKYILYPFPSSCIPRECRGVLF